MEALIAAFQKDGKREGSAHQGKPEDRFSCRGIDEDPKGSPQLNWQISNLTRLISTLVIPMRRRGHQIPHSRRPFAAFTKLAQGNKVSLPQDSMSQTGYILSHAPHRPPASPPSLAVRASERR